MRMNLAIWLLAPVVFLITRNPLTGPWRVLLAFLALIWLLVDVFYLAKNNEKRRLLDIVIFALFLVGATNWFFSPFFFVLYLLTIGITFVFTPAAGLGFVISLVLLFVFNVGEVDVAYDSLVLLSLLGTFPVAIFLRKEYLKLQEGQKAILILEKQAREAQTTVEKLLANVVTYTSAELRAPLVNIKNHAHILISNKKLPAKKAYMYLQRIYESSLTALRDINRFDEESTGKVIQGEQRRNPEPPAATSNS